MLKTLIVCLANCGTPVSTADELGRLSAAYLQSCHELQELRRQRCPELTAPPLLQCTQEVERQLPARYRADFRRGLPLLEQRFTSELPAAMAARFAAELKASGGEAGPACAALGSDIDHQRSRIRQQLRSLAGSR